MSRVRLGRIVLPLLVFAVLLAGIEIGVRTRLPHFASRDFFLTLFGDPPDGTPRGRQPLFDGDPVLFWRLRPDVKEAIWDFTVVSTNAQGFRHARDIGDKPPGRFRIVCVGDSVTFGFRIPLVFPDAPDQYDRNDAPYPMRLERMLVAEYPARDVEVIALAVPGYSSFQGRILLERTIDWLEPDVVVICFGFNDIARKPFPDREIMDPGVVPTTLRRVMSSSQALLQLWRWWHDRKHQTPVEQPPPAPRVAREDYVRNVLAMVELARDRGAAALVLGPVYRDRTTNPTEAERMGLYRATLQDAMLQRDVPYLQIDELTEKSAPANEPLFGEHVHPSSAGHQLMAERIVAALRAHGMLSLLAAHDTPPGYDPGGARRAS
jgi:lysophospholipase L1-like esterase